jgi:D-alanine-D-alanine ligase
VRIGNPQELLARAGKGELPALDAAWNIAEGYGSRNREAWAPVLLEMLHVPVLGSDALTLSLSLDKAWCNTLVAAAGVPVPPQAVLATAGDAERAALPGSFPLFAKPRWEGTAKGIHPGSRVDAAAALAREVERIVRDYAQPALVQPFLPGAEYTVCVVGHRPPRALAVLQRALEAASGIGVHALERHPAPAGGWRHRVAGELSPELEATLAAHALCVFEALACRDFGRVDFRLDADGAPWFLEINPLPTFAPDGSFGILAELEGRSLEDLLAEVLREGLVRLGLA